MQINRKRVLDAFADYTSHYDASDEKIKLKIDHTYRVAQLCERIAKSLHLSNEDVDLAWLLGMLHDVGRFEQLRNYGTFSDADSIDHAQYAVQILFDDGKIQDYISMEELSEEYDLIRTAIWNHSVYRIEDGLSDRVIMFCNILRDADKVDILKVNHDIPLEVIYSVSTQEVRNAVVTQEVMNQFLEHHAILRNTKKNCVDNAVGHIALVFELVFQESFRVVKEQGYLDKMLSFDLDNEITRKQFVTLRQCMDKFLLEKQC